MARRSPPRSSPSAGDSAALAGALPLLLTWAQTLGEALGRGMARGLQAQLTESGFPAPAAAEATAVRRRGRPPKVPPGMPLPPDRLCRVPDCGREARSRGLCSAHYQAERRRLIKRS